MKVVCLVEDSTCNKKVKPAHGLSMYIETNNKKILFDCGPSDLFITNAKLLNVDLSEVEYLVLSSNSIPHIGGLEYFLQINTKAQIIIIQDYLENEAYQNIKSRIITNQDVFQIDEAISLHITKKEEVIEQSLKIIEDELVYVVSGCSKTGIFNILDTISKDPIYALFGGFNTIKKDIDQTYTFNLSDDEANEFNNKLNEYKIQYIFTGHSTTKKGVKKLGILNKDIKPLITAKEYIF